MGDAITIAVDISKRGFEKGCNELKGAINSLQKGAGRLFGDLKRLVPSILGVGSVFGVITKAVSTFMSQNVSLTKQMEACWTTLGNLLGPIVQQVISWVTMAVSYLVQFLNLLGVTSKTASQLSKAANKAGGELQKTIAGFDELNVMQASSGSGAGSVPDMEPSQFLGEFAGLLEEGKYGEAGSYLADYFNKAIDSIDWEGIGTKIANAFEGAVSFIGAFIRDFDTRELGSNFATLINKILNVDSEGGTTWTTVGEILMGKFTLVFGAVTGFLETLDTAALATAVSDIIIGALNALTEAIGEADWEKIGQNIGDFFENIKWEEIASGCWDLFSEAFGSASDLWEGLPDWLQKIAAGIIAIKAAQSGITIFNTLTSSLTRIKDLNPIGIFEKLGTVMATTAAGAGTLNEAMTMVFGPVATTIAGIGTIIAGAFLALTNFWDMLKNGFNWLSEILMVVGIAIVAVGAVILGAPVAIAACVAAVVAVVLTAIVLIKDNWEAIKAWFSATVAAIGAFFSNMFSKIGEFCGSCVDAVKEKWEAIKAWFSGIVSTISGFFSNMFSKIGDFGKKCVDGIKSAFTSAKTFLSSLLNGIVQVGKNAINSVIGGINGMISGLVGGVNAVTSTLNRLKFTIPSWVPVIGGKEFGLSLPIFTAPQIPMLEKGGILKRGQIGLLEGNGAEAVVPLEKNTEWINKLADAFMLRVQNGNYDLGGGTNVLSTLNSIADKVSYRTPAVAQGAVVPYCVSGAGGSAWHGGTDSELAEAVQELSEKLDQIMDLMETIQFVADFGDGIRALAKKITKEQKREKILEGR